MTDVNLRALELNDQYLPKKIVPDLSTISVKDAIHQYLNDGCEVIQFYDRPVLSGHRQIIHPEKGPLFWPSVVVHKKSGKKGRKLRPSRENLYLREHQVCFWCDKSISYKEVTRDHVIPKKLGGDDSFLNVVCACDECNQQKADSPPTGRWTPKKKIFEPTFYELLEIRKKFPIYIDDMSWKMFLPEWSSDMILRTSNNVRI